MIGYLTRKMFKRKKKGFVRRIVSSVVLTFASTLALEWAKKKSKEKAKEMIQQEEGPVEFKTQSIRK